jgi:thioredoxin reductase (NADPH)
MKKYDTIIIGGGPAGLSAAIYLGRFLRSVLVLDDGDGRSTYAQINENYLGFPEGIAATELRKLGKKQAEKFGAEFVTDEVTDISGEFGNFTVTGKEEYLGKTVIIATGVTDKFPLFENSSEYIGKSLFWCITCDGYKAKDKKVVVIGNDDEAASNALELLNYTKEITVLTNNDKGESNISDYHKEMFAKHTIPLIEGCLVNVEGENGFISKVNIDTGETIHAKLIFSYQGSNPNSSLGFKLKLDHTKNGFIVVDHTQKTSMKGVYAAGDVSTGHSHQIVAAACEGSSAAEAINYELYEDFQK